MAKGDRPRAPARRSSAGTARIRSTPTAGAFRSRASMRWPIRSVPLSGVRRVLGVGQRRRSTSRATTCGPHRRFLRRRRGHRPGDAAAWRARRAADASSSSKWRRRVSPCRAPAASRSTTRRDAELTLRFIDTSLDPYVRLFEPRLSPFTTAIASGTLRVVGPLARPRRALRVDGDGRGRSICGCSTTSLRNDGPIALALGRGRRAIERLRLVGEGTTLELAGDVRIARRAHAHARDWATPTWACCRASSATFAASGAARGSGRDRAARCERPCSSAARTITNGRLRYFALPHSIEAVNGRVEFDAGGVAARRRSRARMGGGEVRFGGRVGVQRRRTVESYDAHRGRPRHAPALSRGLPVAGRRGPGAARHRRAARC